MAYIRYDFPVHCVWRVCSVILSSVYILTDYSKYHHVRRTLYGVYWRTLTHTDVPDVHWRTLTYTDVHWRTLTYLTYTDVHWRILTYTDVHWRTLMYTDVNWRTLAYTDVHCTTVYVSITYIKLIWCKCTRVNNCKFFNNILINNTRLVTTF